MAACVEVRNDGPARKFPAIRKVTKSGEGCFQIYDHLDKKPMGQFPTRRSAREQLEELRSKREFT
jgi:hypothetical protein